MTKKKPTTPQSKPEFKRSWLYLSLRWRFITPLFVVVLLVAMGGAYLIAGNLAGGLAISQENLLLRSSSTVGERANAHYERQRDEAQRVAFTVGIAEAIMSNNATSMEPLLRSLARVGDLDTIIVTDLDGREVLGLQAVTQNDSVSYAISDSTDLSEEPLVRAVLDESVVGSTGILITPNGLMLFTAVPVYFSDEAVGVALVGNALDTVLDDLQGSAYTDLVLYGADRNLLQTTFAPEINRAALAIPGEVFNQAAGASGQVPLTTVTIGETLYQSAYQPFTYGANTLGVIGAFMPDDVPFVTALGRQLVALFAAALTGVVIVIAYTSISRIAWRAERVQKTAESLAQGENARTGMKAREEIGAIGRALDTYAEQVDIQQAAAQQRQDELQKELRRQRRESAHMMAVLDAMPDGIVVQALDGRVVMMNDLARELLGSQRVYRSTGLHELAEVVGDELGPAIAPGLYALGDPRRVDFDDRVLHAQAAAVMSVSERRLGTVIVLRDITAEVVQERERDAMMNRIAAEIQQPLAGLARAGMQSGSNMVNAFAREIARHAVTLQKMIVEMQDLTNIDAVTLELTQRPIHLETLIWALANEWRQIAQANGLTLHILIEKRDLFVLGDERRLRWAIGNLLDNAIRYTRLRDDNNGALTLEIKPDSKGMANLRIRDNGVGISKQDLPAIFTRFFRGTPSLPNGEVIRVPGMGQGLYTARQIIALHGGKISVRSTQGVGTAVYFSLPLTSGETMPITQLGADMEGDTVQLPAEFLVELEK